MERQSLRGGASPNSRGLEEHIIQMPNLEAEQTEEQHPQPLLSQSQILQQQPQTPHRRRVFPIDPIFDSNPTTPPAFTNHHHRVFEARNPDFRVRRFICSPRFLHACPVIVLLCVFLLWWFSSPVNLAIKDGRIIQHSSNARPFDLNTTDLSLSRMTILAAATSLNPNIELIMSVIDKAGDNASPLSSSN